MAGDGKAGRRGKAGAGGQGADRRARIAAQRAAAQRAQRRNRMLIAGGAIVAVVAVVIAFVALSGSSSSNNASGTATGPPPTGSALARVIATTTTVPAATLDQVGAGQVSAPPTTISGAPLTSGGKPEMLYIGAEYCPYCAAERWAMVVALSRFGTLSGLAATHSAAKNGAGQAEIYPNTATWTFANAHLASGYLTFAPVELYTNVPDPGNGGYTPLQTPTAKQETLLRQYDASGSIPFVDYGNKYVSVGASYDPGVLTGLTWGQIAADLHNPASPVAKGVLGTANYMTAAICRLTGDRPASACTPVVKSLQAKL
jgi:Domain of unknown function (DUF929)